MKLNIGGKIFHASRFYCDLILKVHFRSCSFPLSAGRRERESSDVLDATFHTDPHRDVTTLAILLLPVREETRWTCS